MTAPTPSRRASSLGSAACCVRRSGQYGDELTGLLDELAIEGATAAEEVERNPRSYELLKARLPHLGLVPHEELKRIVASAKLVVRTGEATPYSNVILRCGVPF